MKQPLPQATMSQNSDAHFFITSIGDALFVFAIAVLRLRLFMVYSTASPGMDRGSRLANIIGRSMFNTVRCMLSTFSFYAWMCALLTFRETPFDLKKRSTFAYSTPSTVGSTCICSSNDLQRISRSVYPSTRICPFAGARSTQQ